MNKQQVLRDLREQGLRIHSIELEDAAVRVVGSVAILTAASKIVSSRHGKESQTFVRLVAVYGQDGGAIRLVHFQSTMIVEKPERTAKPAGGLPIPIRIISSSIPDAFELVRRFRSSGRKPIAERRRNSE